jgi:hypothetical protein
VHVCCMGGGCRWVCAKETRGGHQQTCSPAELPGRRLGAGAWWVFMSVRVRVLLWVCGRGRGRGCYCQCRCVSVGVDVGVGGCMCM